MLGQNGWCIMRILVLSDSHAGLSFMRYCVKAVNPDVLVHLGDYFDDGAVLAEENPHIVCHQVPGNCDRGRCAEFHPEVLCYTVGGVMLFMTHGHKHHVKMGLGGLLREARTMGAQAALYGHTHMADCHREEDGLWVLNPGSCGQFGGSAGLIETENGNITVCRLLRQSDLEEML